MPPKQPKHPTTTKPATLNLVSAQERQEHLLQELLAMKRKKRGARRAMPSPEPGPRSGSQGSEEGLGGAGSAEGAALAI